MWSNTNEMKYSTKWHMYILDVEYVRKALGLDFVEKEKSLAKAQDKMYQISRTIYNYIYNHTRQKRHVEYHLAMEEELRPLVQEILEWQCRYEYESDALLLSMQLGVNPLNGITLGLNDLRGARVISKQAEDLMITNGLLYAGRYMGSRRESEFDYTEMGY